MPGNRIAYWLWCRCSGQLIMGMGGAVDINILAVIALMNLEGIEDQDEHLERVQTLAHIVLAEKARKASEETSPGQGR